MKINPYLKEGNKEKGRVDEKERANFEPLTFIL